MKTLFTSAAVVLLSTVITALSLPACQTGSQDNPATVTAAVPQATASFMPVSARIVPTSSPQPPASPEPAADTTPTQPPVSRDVSLSQPAGPLQVTLFISPARAGQNEISFYFIDPDGLWITVQSVEIRVTFLDVESAPVVETVSPLHPGHAFISGDHLRHGGRWQIEAAFEGPGLDAASVSFVVLIL
jgi:hypothetical protein